MPTFEYKVRDKKGKLLKGKMAVLDKQKLIEKLQKSQLNIIEIHEVKEKKKEEGKKGGGILDKVRIGRGVSDDEMAFFTRQLATILRAGVSLNRIISILYNQAKSRRLKQAIHEVGIDLQKGSSFTDALKKHPAIFDEMYVSMVSVGEIGGNLPTAVARVADILEKSLAIKKKIRAAMAYPVFILIFSTILVYVLLAHFLPIFTPLFDEFGLDLNKDYPITAFLVKLSDVVTNTKGVIAAVIVIIAIVIAFKLFTRSKFGKMVMDTIALNVPGFGGLVRQAALARFCRSFASLFAAGVPMLKAMELVAGAAGNTVVSAAIERMAGNIRGGKSLSEALSKEKVFPEIVVDMVKIGEESGSLTEMMEKTADYFDQNLDNAVTTLTSILEPAMMVFVGGVVGIFVIGVILPMLSITSKMKV
ncbi:MAG: type II secretion system F family protein [Candidatus Eremiobacteraeota bacterium]|nr:type II secretion system F family protein [Candidatus Eremiobacteraeota bacterium]